MLFILIDSSTKGTRETKYGKSTAFWYAAWNDYRNMPCRAGIIYSEFEGPNKIFYDGIIRALDACFFMVRDNCIVKVLGDNNLVIKQINGDMSVIELKPFYDQVKKIESKYSESGRGTIVFDYINEEDDFYRKVDRCAKEFENFMRQRFS